MMPRDSDVYVDCYICDEPIRRYTAAEWAPDLAERPSDPEHLYPLYPTGRWICGRCSRRRDR